MHSLYILMGGVISDKTLWNAKKQVCAMIIAYNSLLLHCSITINGLVGY